jgi:GTP cyclohydrolase I
MQNKTRPSKKEAEEAVRTLIRYIGDNTERDDLKNTPTRVIKSFEEFFSGYNPEGKLEEVAKTFKKTKDYNGMVLLKDIRYESYCEHHFAPIIGVAHIAYIPDEKIIGLSKLARIIDLFSKRLTIQERVVMQAASLLEEIVQPLGVAVFIEANHNCLSTRGAHKTGANMITEHYTGVFNTNSAEKMHFLKLVK